MSNLMKQYLGDSVYVERTDCGDFKLYTDNGCGPTNIIYLDSGVLEALDRYRKWIKSQEKSDAGSTERSVS